MLEATYSKDGVTVTFKRATRGTAINVLLITEALRDRYPESRKEGTDQIGQTLSVMRLETIAEFATLAAHMAVCSGLPYALPTVADPDALQKAYEHFLNDSTDLYAELGEMVARLNAPLTDAAQKPQEALTEAEKTDPLSPSAGRKTSGRSKGN